MIPFDYAVYAAKKNGKRCNDIPALDPKQNILLTRLKYYYLGKRKPEYKTPHTLMKPEM